MIKFILSHLTICIVNVIFAVALLLLLWLPHKKIFNNLNNKKILKKFIQVPYLVGILLIVIVGVYDINYFYHYMKVQNSPQLTGVTATVLTVMATVFGYFYNKKQDKIQAIHAESKWRSRLLDLEKKPYYTINDLLELNTFINPYHKKADNLDYFINLAIRTILNSKALDIKPEHEFDYFYKKVNETLNDKNLSINKKVLMILKKEEFYNNLYGCEQDLELKKNKFEADDVTDTTVKANSEKKYQFFKCETFSDYKIKYINKNKKQIDFFNPYETVVIRKCIHALLKDDWVRVND